MAKSGTRELDRIFHALSDATRRSILQRMGDGELTVTQIAEPYDLTLAAISKHLKVLDSANLIERRKVGSYQLIKLNAETLMNARQWLDHYERFWTKRLDMLADMLNEKAKS